MCGLWDDESKHGAIVSLISASLTGMMNDRRSTNRPVFPPTFLALVAAVLDRVCKRRQVWIPALTLLLQSGATIKVSCFLQHYYRFTVRY